MSYVIKNAGGKRVFKDDTEKTWYQKHGQSN